MDTHATDIEGFILIGGASSRMGVDKAWLPLDDLTFAGRISAALASITTDVGFIGAGRPEEGSASMRRVPDVYTGVGALGGLHAALDACRRSWAAVVACDLPFVTSELFGLLAAQRGNYDAVVPRQLDGRLQPLCALYRRDPCLRVAEEMIAAGERRPRILVGGVQSRIVEPREWAQVADGMSCFLNVNTPDEYRHAQDLQRSRGRMQRGIAGADFL